MGSRIQQLVRLVTIRLAVSLAGAASAMPPFAPVPLFAQNSATIQARANVVPRIVYQAAAEATNLNAARYTVKLTEGKSTPVSAPTAAGGSPAGPVITRRELEGGAVLLASYRPADYRIAAHKPEPGPTGAGEQPPGNQAQVEILFIAN